MTLPTATDYIAAVAETFNVPVKRLYGRQRDEEVVKARAAATYFLRAHKHLSYPQIGSLLGGRDHSTVIASYRKAERLLVDDPVFRRAIDEATHGARGRWDNARIKVRELVEVEKAVNETCAKAIADIRAMRNRLMAEITRAVKLQERD